MLYCCSFVRLPQTFGSVATYLPCEKPSCNSSSYVIFGVPLWGLSLSENLSTGTIFPLPLSLSSPFHLPLSPFPPPISLSDKTPVLAVGRSHGSKRQFLPQSGSQPSYLAEDTKTQQAFMELVTENVAQGFPIKDDPATTRYSDKESRGVYGIRSDGVIDSPFIHFTSREFSFRSSPLSTSSSPSLIP